MEEQVKPHVCPKCLGEGMIPADRQTTGASQRPCPVCKGTGVLWEPHKLTVDGIRLQETTPCIPSPQSDLSMDFKPGTYQGPSSAYAMMLRDSMDVLHP